MILFWIGALVLTLFAALAIFWPWIVKSKREALDQNHMNVVLVKERVTELKQDLEENILPEEERAQAESELKLALLEEVDEQKDSGSSSNKRSNSAQHGASRWLLTGFAVISVAVTVASYWKSNEIADIENWLQAQDRLPELGERMMSQPSESLEGEDYQDFILGLRTRLADKPDDAVGWLLLGRMLASAQNVDYAVESFEKSLAINPEQVGTLVSYGQLLLLVNDPDRVVKARRMLAKAVMLSPNDTSAMALLALAAERSGEPDMALATWQELAIKMPQDNPMQATIQEKIASLSGERTELQVALTLDESMASSLSEYSHLFLFARNANSGMKMPAAVIKQELKQNATLFPLTLTLSDSNAMIPTLNLSSLEEAVVIARLSRDDNVQTLDGDIQGEAVIPIQKGKSQSISIQINKELP